MTERAIWTFTEKDKSGWEQGTVDVTATAHGALLAVSEEQAVDSYNETFTCSVAVPKSEIPALIAVLQLALQ